MLHAGLCQLREATSLGTGTNRRRLLRWFRLGALPKTQSQYTVLTISAPQADTLLKTEAVVDNTN